MAFRTDGSSHVDGIKNEKQHITQLTLQKDSFRRVLDDENFDTFTEQRTDTENKDYDLNTINEVL